MIVHYGLRERDKDFLKHLRLTQIILYQFPINKQFTHVLTYSNTDLSNQISKENTLVFNRSGTPLYLTVTIISENICSPTL